jgi:hypothetical protein
MSWANGAHKLIGAATILVVLGVSTHAWLVISRHGRLAAMRRELHAAGDRDARDLAEQRLQELSDLAASYKNAVPLGDDVADLLDTLTSDLDDLGVGRRAWSISPVDAEGHFRKTSIDLSFEGTLPAAFELLGRIATYPRLVRVRRISVRREQTSPGLIVSMTLDTFATSGDSRVSMMGGSR